MPTIYQIVIVALLAAFTILFLDKTGIRIKLRDACDKAGISILADMLDCDFCLSFWTCVCVSIGLVVLGVEVGLLVPPCAAPIVRYLL